MERQEARHTVPEEMRGGLKLRLLAAPLRPPFAIPSPREARTRLASPASSASPPSAAGSHSGGIPPGRPGARRGPRPHDPAEELRRKLASARQPEPEPAPSRQRRRRPSTSGAPGCTRRPVRRSTRWATTEAQRDRHRADGARPRAGGRADAGRARAVRSDRGPAGRCPPSRRAGPSVGRARLGAARRPFRRQARPTPGSARVGAPVRRRPGVPRCCSRCCSWPGSQQRLRWPSSRRRVIAGVMAGSWVLVALIEWSASRAERPAMRFPASSRSPRPSRCPPIRPGSCRPSSTPCSSPQPTRRPR